MLAHSRRKRSAVGWKRPNVQEREAWLVRSTCGNLVEFDALIESQWQRLLILRGNTAKG
jgi:hypothetical protein